jgi:hypothetical protein
LPAANPRHAEPAGDRAQAARDFQKATSHDATAVAYIGREHQHHLIADGGTALHLWQNRWRLVRLKQSSAKAGPYLIYQEVDQPGCNWAYGRYPFGCDRFPIFFQPGASARWCFIGYATRIRPLAQ